MIQIGTLNMPEWAVVVLMITGFTSIFAAVIMIGAFLLDDIGDWIKYKKYEYKKKHRFNKPPTAKCYCKDCRNFVDRAFDKHCAALKGIHVHDNYFCWAAEPRITDPDKEEDKNV